MGDPAGFPVNPAKRIPLKRIDDIESDEAFDLVERAQPFVARTKGWATDKWDLDYFKKKVGDAPYPVVKVEDGERLETTIADALDLILDPFWRRHVRPIAGGGPLIHMYDFKKGLVEQNKVLLDDFRFPRFIPREYCSAHILIRNSSREPDGYFFTPCHWEPTALPTVFMQVKGKKHLWLFSPEESKHLATNSELLQPPHVSGGADACDLPDQYPGLENATCFEVVLEEGDIVYFPEFWYHWFVHYHELQINLRLYFEPQRLYLTPVSAAWAYSNAMAAALGGFDGLAEKIAGLDPEVRKLLVDIEQQLFNDPDLLRPSQQYYRRFGGKRKLKPDPRALSKDAPNTWAKPQTT